MRDIAYKLNQAARILLGIWLFVILVAVLASQAKRMQDIYGKEVEVSDLDHEVEHLEEKEYVFYEEEPKEEGWNGKILCIGDKKSYWTTEQLETLPEDHKVTAGMEVLTITLPSKSIIFRKSSVSYVKFSCLGEEGFTDTEIAFYKQAAANKFTYERHVKLRLKDAVAYKEFIPNEWMD